ncbi:MAG: hypothetical protein ACOCRU_01125 [bacterium]
MNYIVKCNKCQQKSICEINQPEDKKCKLCGATGDDVKVEISIEEAMPPLDLISKGMNSKL